MDALKMSEEPKMNALDTRTAPPPIRVMTGLPGRFLDEAAVLARAEDLHHRARQGQWDLEQATRWLHAPRLEEVTLQPPLISEKLAAHWPTLPPPTRAELVRTVLSCLLTNLAFGEGFVDDTASELSDRLENIDLARLTVFQSTDEARHTEALKRYLKQLGEPRLPVALQVQSRLPAGVDVRRDPWQGIALMVLTLEIAALCAIQGLRTYCDEPLLQALLKRILSDESRHVSTLVLALRSPDGQLGLAPDSEARARIQEIALLSWSRALEVTELPVLVTAMTLDVQTRLFPTSALEQARAMESIEQVSTEWAWYRLQLARTLLPKLETFGLLDDALLERLIQAGCPVQAVSPGGSTVHATDR